MRQTVVNLCCLLWLFVGRSEGACDAEDVTFELVTGYVFTSPSQILDTMPGVLFLEDCLEQCRQNDTCLSINYETGLCVLFDSSAEANPDALFTSQFPVFTLYAQKICVRNARPRCPRQGWTFDKMKDYRLDGHSQLTRKVESREACLALCLAARTFNCRSASFNRLLGDCILSHMDRHTLPADQADNLQRSLGWDYLESNCATEPSAVCYFKPIEGQIMKTVDSVYAGVKTFEECRQLCIEASYRCHSFDYGDTGENICRLSHHSSATLRDIRDPYLRAGDAITYEMGACYNVSVECQSSYMVAHVATNRIFSGKLYDRSRPNSCNANIQNSLEFELYLGFNDIDCDVKQENPGKFSSDVVIQHHPMIVTSSDVGLKIRCNYDVANRTVSNTARLAVSGGLNQAGAENTVVRSPNVTLRVTDRNGGDITSAQVGDPLALRFEILDGDSSPYEIFVRELVAMDGMDSSEIELVDKRGCPADAAILGPLREVNGTGRKIQADFDAFKFPTSDVVQFRALVTPCIPRCDPVQCDIIDFYGQEKSILSFGRRKRRRRRSSEGQQSSDELMVAGVIRISDKFHLGEEDQQKRKKGVTADQGSRATTRPDDGVTWKNEKGSEPVGCLNSLAFGVGASVFLLAQCVLIGFWTYLYYKRKKFKEDTLNADCAAMEDFYRPKKSRKQQLTLSSLQDYDPYFAPASECYEACSRSNSSRHQCSRLRGVSQQPRSPSPPTLTSSSSTSLQDELETAVSASSSGSSSLEQRNL